MAKAFPKSKFYGFDNHGPSIERAREAAKNEGVADRVTFEKAASNDFPNKGFDLIAFFDCLHDMGNPIAACKRARECVKPDGHIMVVEPMAGKNVEDNF